MLEQSVSSCTHKEKEDNKYIYYYFKNKMEDVALVALLLHFYKIHKCFHRDEFILKLCDEAFTDIR